MDRTAPFGDAELPRSQMQWTEAAPSLEGLLRSQAEENGIELLRDREVRLDCSMPDGTVMRFVIFWPAGEERMNVLAPAKAIDRGSS